MDRREEGARPKGGRPAGLRLVAGLPAAGLALFAFAVGNLAGGATALGALAGALAVLVAAVAAGPRWRDPLELGRRGRWLPWALWVTLAASVWASPVPRAGLLPALLLPAYLLLPAAVARAWDGREARLWGARTVALVAAAVALWSLAGRYVYGDPRAAAPLGHHLLLGVFLLAIWPLAILPALRDRGAVRWLSLAASAVSILAILLTGSLAVRSALLGQLALLALLLALVARRHPAFRGLRWHVTIWLFVASMIALAALALPRLEAVTSGSDPSARARAIYLRAGLAGVAERPLLGWGAGSVPWTVAEHLRPEPGVNPPGEMVADLHTLPLQLAYEVGLPATGLALAILWLFVRRHWRRRTGAADPVFVRLGLLGILGAGLASLASGWWAVTALPVALAVSCGAVLAGGTTSRQRPTGWRPYLPVAVYAAAVMIALTPCTLAQLAYDRAARANDPRAVERGLADAAARDPRFPWYRLLAASAGAPERDPLVARAALAAAESGYAVAPLWLVAGASGAEVGEPWAEAALERACRLDPLGALAPFYRLTFEPRAEVARTAGARALLAAPRLAAATFWQEHPELLSAAVVGVLRADGVDAGWREAFAARVAELGGPDGRTGESLGGELVVELGLQVDPTPSESVPLRVFRRRRWPLLLAPVPLSADAVGRLDLPPASELATTEAEVFSTAGCGVGRAAEPGPG